MEIMFKCEKRTLIVYTTTSTYKNATQRFVNLLSSEQNVQECDATAD